MSDKMSFVFEINSKADTRDFITVEAADEDLAQEEAEKAILDRYNRPTITMVHDDMDVELLNGEEARLWGNKQEEKRSDPETLQKWFISLKLEYAERKYEIMATGEDDAIEKAQGLFKTELKSFKEDMFDNIECVDFYSESELAQWKKEVEEDPELPTLKKESAQ